jgi:hypothetical protein
LAPTSYPIAKRNPTNIKLILGNVSPSIIGRHSKPQFSFLPMRYPWEKEEKSRVLVYTD